MKYLISALLILTLSACGGANKFKRENKSYRTAPARSAQISQPIYVTPGARGASLPSSPAISSVPTRRFARGPIQQACQRSDRKARSSELCGCIQAAADKSLSKSQQARAVQFYDNPQLAQDTRQSDRTSDERFWQAYRAYGETAERMCK